MDGELVGVESVEVVEREGGIQFGAGGADLIPLLRDGGLGGAQVGVVARRHCLNIGEGRQGDGSFQVVGCGVRLAVVLEEEDSEAIRAFS